MVDLRLSELLQKIDSTYDVKVIKTRDKTKPPTEMVCIDIKFFKELETNWFEEDKNKLDFKDSNRLEDKERKKQLIKRVNDFIDQIAGDGKRSEILNNIKEYYGYEDLSGVYKAIRNGDFSAIDILIFEELFGGHRDEILGPIPDKEHRVSNFDKLHALMKENDDLRNAINSVLRLLVRKIRSKRDIEEKLVILKEIKAKLDNVDSSSSNIRF